MKTQQYAKSSLALVGAFLSISGVLASCTTTSTSTSTSTGLNPEPLNLVVAKPQVIYRIDAFRYFILESRGNVECNDGRIFYIDENLQIKSVVESWERAELGRRKFTIDASNEKYLGAPTEGSSGNCSSGSGNCFGSATVFSVDYGRTWLKRREGSDANILIVGNKFYEYQMSTINENKLGRANGAYFDMSAPDKVKPYLWVEYAKPGTPWTLSDYGMRVLPEKPNTGEKQYLAKLNVFQAEQPEKIEAAILPTRKPIENAFHCVKEPIVNNE